MTGGAPSRGTSEGVPISVFLKLIDAHRNIV